MTRNREMSLSCMSVEEKHPVFKYLPCQCIVNWICPNPKQLTRPLHPHFHSRDGRVNTRLDFGYFHTIAAIHAPRLRWNGPCFLFPQLGKLSLVTCNGFPMSAIIRTNKLEFLGCLLQPSTIPWWKPKLSHLNCSWKFVPNSMREFGSVQICPRIFSALHWCQGKCLLRRVTC